MITVTRYGNTVDGGSNQDPSADIHFDIPITVVADGWAVAVEFHIQGGIFIPTSILMANNGGVPGQILGWFPRSVVNTTFSSTVRQITNPLGLWITAGAYFVGVQSPAGAGAGQLRYVTGASGVGFASDGNVTSVVVEPGTTGATAPAATTRAYTIQLVVLGVTESLPPAPAADSGNRMGGTGAIRKPPRLIK